MNKYIITFLFLIPISCLGQKNDFLDRANQYYIQKEYDKAIRIYEILLKQNHPIKEFHSYYLSSLFEVKAYKKAKKYVEKQIKNNSNYVVLVVDYGKIISVLEGEEKQKKYYLDYIEDENMYYNLYVLGQFLKDMEFFALAEKAFLKYVKNVYLFDVYMELLTLYEKWGKNEKTIDMIISLMKTSNDYFSPIQNFISDYIKSEEQKSMLYKKMIKTIQSDPYNYYIRELLIWYLIQQNKFDLAFIQAVSLEKKVNTGGNRLFDLGQMSKKNNNFPTAIAIFEYIVKNYSNKVIGINAEMELVRIKEKWVTSQFPIEEKEIHQLIDQYSIFLGKYGVNKITHPLVIDLAKLYAFYSQDSDRAKEVLQDLLQQKHIDKNIEAKAKMMLADIYMYNEIFWEALLLYGQVAKKNEGRAIGYMANLKKATLYYYKGDFELSKSILDILKIATSKEIANDAMRLFTLISDNVDLDTTEVAMKTFCKIDFLIFQNRIPQAIKEYKEMIDTFPNHSLEDEILWNIGNLYVKTGNYQQALHYFFKVLEEHEFDILADDASYQICVIYQKHIKDYQKAMQSIETHLKKFSHSLYNQNLREQYQLLEKNQ